MLPATLPWTRRAKHSWLAANPCTSSRRHHRSRQVVDAIFDVSHRWTIYISGMCVDQAGGEYLTSVEIAPDGMYLASQLTEAM